MGSNIRKQIPEIGKNNIPEDFDALYSYHQGFTWKDNLERIVEKTSDIKPMKSKAVLCDRELDNLLESPCRADIFVRSGDYIILLEDLRKRCEEARDAILVASHIDNVNVRGRLIEVLVTTDSETRTKLLRDLADEEKLLPVYDTKNGLGDYVRKFDNADTYTDIKTKILYLDSNPKAYNIT